MAKLFYTLDEAALKLKKSVDEVRALVESGQLQEFRDRDKVMLKVDQVDLLAGGGEDDVIPLAESGEFGSGIQLASDSGSGMNLESPKEQTGISIFEADQTEEADPSAVTQITERAPTELSIDSVGSGSGLMDLAREADDTSLGQNLLGDIDQAQRQAEAPAETSAEASGEAGALFEPTPAEAEEAAVAGAGSPLMVAAEPYDGTWSGITGGVALGMVLVAAFAVALAIFGLSGSPGGLVAMVAQNLWMWVGIAAGVIVLPAIIGLVVGRRTA